MAENNHQIQNGDILLREHLPGGGFGPFLKPGKTENFNMSAEIEKLTSYDTEDIETVPSVEVVTKRTVNVTMTTRDMTNKFAEIAHGASMVLVTQTASAATPAILTAVVLDTTSDLGYYKITDFIVKDSGDTITYVEDIDYTIDKKWGYFTPLSTGAIVDATDVNLTITTEEITDGASFEAFSAGQTNYELTFLGISSLGESDKYVFPKVNLSMDGELILKAGEDASFTEITFTGTILKHAGSYYSKVTI